MTNYRQSMAEAFNKVVLGEDNMDLMKKAAGGAMQKLKMKDGKLQMDSFTASAIMQIYKAVNPKNKASMERMINSGSKSQIMKLQSLAMRQIKSGYHEKVELDEAKYEIKNGKVHISKKEFAKVSKDYKGKDTMTVLDPKTGATVNMPVVFEEVGIDEARQLKNPKKEVMVVKKGEVIVINKKDAKEYLNKGWDLAEEVELDEVPNKMTQPVIVMRHKDNKNFSVSVLPNAKNIKAKEKKGMRIDHALVPSPSGNAREVKDPKEIMKLIKGGDKLKIGESLEAVDLDEKKIFGVEFQIDAPDEKPIRTGNEPHVKIINKFVKKYKLFDDHADDLSKFNVKDEVGGRNVMKFFKDIEKAGLNVIKKKITDNLTVEEVELDEGARADAMRAMRKDREVDPADVDSSASDDDVKAASKNIIMQLRKSVSLRGNFPVEFMDKKKVKVNAKIAQSVQNKYNSMKKATDKEKFQAKISKSYKDMLSALKENYGNKQESTILDRVGKKLREIKNG